MEDLQTRSGWIDRNFVNHPRAVGETYGQHLLFALRIGAELLALGICLLLHGLVPRLFEFTASDGVFRLNDLFVARRNKVKSAE